MSSEELTKPRLDEAQATELIVRLYGLGVERLAPLESYDDQNFHVATNDGAAWVLKVTNTRDSRQQEVLEVQTRVMMFLRDGGVPTQTVRLTVHGDLMSLQRIDFGEGEKEFNVRLLTYLPGVPLSTVLADGSLYYQVGKLAASIHQALEQFEHPFLRFLQRDDFIWNLSNTHLLESYLFALDGDPNQGLVREVIAKFREEIQPNLHKFTRCIVHGDLNDHNILVEETGPIPAVQSSETGEPAAGSHYKLSGVLDFNDMMQGYCVYDIAMAIMYMMIESSRPMDVGGHIMAGYESVRPLTEDERGAVYWLVASRFCQSLVLARYTILQHPENADYLLTTARTGWERLRRLWATGREGTQRLWSDVAARHTNTDSLSLSPRLNFPAKLT
ncbi:hydroxylysine kinase [Petromyzon marinus]|uniref:hydroxylysine kinase n=1 Tax=Petromyzon marinus TaxID=7757 RepID=UPI003F707F29